MSNFLRGGQVTAHKFRMTFQVIRIMVRIALVVMLATVFMTFKNNVESYQWRAVPTILAKYTFQDISPHKVVSYKNKSGIERKIRVRNLKWSREFDYIENSFIYAFMLSLKRLIWVVVTCLSVAMIYFWYRGRSLQENKNMRGSFLVSQNTLKKQVIKHNNGFKGITPYTLADIPYAANGKGKSYTPGEQSHTLVLGSTGSGKTKVIQNLVHQIESRLGEKSEEKADKNSSKIIIVDIKGDYIRHFYNKSRGDIILNPLDKRGANWSFFNETDELKGFDTIAKTLIPDTYGDPFWTNAARILFSELASLYGGQNLSIADFSTKILGAKLKDLEKLLANTRASHIVNQKAEKTAACVLMMLSVYLVPFKLYKKSKDIFSIKDWVNDRTHNNILFIATSPDVKSTLNPLVQMQVDLAVNALCSAKDAANQQVWFILDELAYFDGSIPSLKDGLTTARSFGGAFVLGVQDLSSLSKIYGSDLSRVIANNCRNKLIMNVDDSYTSRWCSDLFGEGEIEEWKEGLSYGSHEMRDGVSSNKNTSIKRTILPSQFSQLSAGSGYMKLPAFSPALVQFKEFYLKDRNAVFIENTDLRKILAEEIKKSQDDKAKLEKELNINKNNIKLDREIADTSPEIIEDNKPEPSF